MKVLDTVTGQRLNVNEAYERFFDGFYNLGRPSEVFQGNVVLSAPKLEVAQPRRRARNRKTGMIRRGRRHLAGRR